MSDVDAPNGAAPEEPSILVRRIHRRDLNKVWEFLKLCFRVVNRETLEYQRPRSKKRFLEVYEEEGVEQLLFEVASEDSTEIVAYAECAFEITGADNWMNESFFTRRDMRPMFVEELAVHPGYQGRGVGSFALEQLEHLARVRGCTHLVLEVAENNKNALQFYRGRHFTKLDAAVFMAKRVSNDEELLPPRPLSRRVASEPGAAKKPVKKPSVKAPKREPAAATTAKKKA
ncbi:MAG: GNAT family N-acetyltransferase [Myxococcaceae bacterium]|nr:MAG: GNAT family N-acetyltransferase [Myxococcaceae bacterium]